MGGREVRGQQAQVVEGQKWNIFRACCVIQGLSSLPATHSGKKVQVTPQSHVDEDRLAAALLGLALQPHPVSLPDSQLALRSPGGHLAGGAQSHGTEWAGTPGPGGVPPLQGSRPHPGSRGWRGPQAGVGCEAGRGARVSTPGPGRSWQARVGRLLCVHCWPRASLRGLQGDVGLYSHLDAKSGPRPVLVGPLWRAVTNAMEQKSAMRCPSSQSTSRLPRLACVSPQEKPPGPSCAPRARPGRALPNPGLGSCASCSALAATSGCSCAKGSAIPPPSFPFPRSSNVPVSRPFPATDRSSSDKGRKGVHAGDLGKLPSGGLQTFLGGKKNLSLQGRRAAGIHFLPGAQGAH